MRKGRLTKPAAEQATRYSQSVSFDRRLYRYDILGSIAHAAALANAGVITTEERAQIVSGLREIEKEIDAEVFGWDHALEDVHMNVEAAARDPILFATDLAEYLVKKGLPFREAHQLVGKLVTQATEAKLSLDNVSLLQMQEISPLFREDVTEIFDARRSLEKRTAIGAPSPENVASRIEHWRTHLRS